MPDPSVEMVGERSGEACRQLVNRNGIGFLEHDAAIAFEPEHAWEHLSERRY
jgi:hypothetical protein